jgi:copper chaperone CopZ
MKKIILLATWMLSALGAQAEYRKVNLTVFGMDCAPCAHAIHVSMKGIRGVDKVDVDLNTGLVSIQLSPGNNATMQQFNAAVEKNGFTHKDAKIIAIGKLSGTPAAPYLDVSGTSDRYALLPSGQPADLTGLFGKTVTASGSLPQATKGKVPERLTYDSIMEAQ